MLYATVYTTLILACLILYFLTRSKKQDSSLFSWKSRLVARFPALQSRAMEPGWKKSTTGVTEPELEALLDEVYQEWVTATEASRTEFTRLLEERDTAHRRDMEILQQEIERLTVLYEQLSAAGNTSIEHYSLDVNGPPAVDISPDLRLGELLRQGNSISEAARILGIGVKEAELMARFRRA